MRVASRSLIVLLIAGVAASAAFAHYAIDVVADYLVDHASFDDFAGHGSREVAGILAIVLGAALAVRGFRLCCDALAARRGPAAGIQPPGWWMLVPFAAATVLAACAAVPLMECIDARFAGEAVDSLADAYGGSVPVGVVTTALCALAVAVTLFALVRWLLSHRERIVAVIVSAIRRSYATPPAARQVRRRRGIVVCRPRLTASRRGLRAPPRTFGSFLLTSNVLRGVSWYTHSLRCAASLRGTCTPHPALP